MYLHMRSLCHCVGHRIMPKQHIQLGIALLPSFANQAAYERRERGGVGGGGGGGVYIDIKTTSFSARLHVLYKSA